MNCNSCLLSMDSMDSRSSLIAWDQRKLSRVVLQILSLSFGSFFRFRSCWIQSAHADWLTFLFEWRSVVVRARRTSEDPAWRTSRIRSISLAHLCEMSDQLDHPRSSMSRSRTLPSKVYLSLHSFIVTAVSFFEISGDSSYTNVFKYRIFIAYVSYAFLLLQSFIADPCLTISFAYIFALLTLSWKVLQSIAKSTLPWSGLFH
jgi:hypothetical protein